MRRLDRSVTLSFIGASLLGLASITLPVWLGDLRRYEAPLFPIVRSGIEGMSLQTLLLLLASGLLLGLLGRGRPALLGFATMALLPLITFAEITASPTSHNLWPLEFVFYGIASLPAVAGAFAGRWLASRFFTKPGITRPPALPDPPGRDPP